jgi:adenylate kinase
VLIVGPPGLARDALYASVAAGLGLACVSTGQLIATEIRTGTAVGHAAQRFVANGLLVPDQLVLRLVAAALRRADHGEPARTSFALAGAPRTIRQADALQAITAPSPPDLVVDLRAPESVIREHLLAGARGARDRVRAQRRLSNYRVLTRPALASIARRRPVIAVDAMLAPPQIRALLVDAVSDLACPRAGVPA